MEKTGRAKRHIYTTHYIYSCCICTYAYPTARSFLCINTLTLHLVCNIMFVCARRGGPQGLLYCTIPLYLPVSCDWPRCGCSFSDCFNAKTTLKNLTAITVWHPARLYQLHRCEEHGLAMVQSSLQIQQRTMAYTAKIRLRRRPQKPNASPPYDVCDEVAVAVCISSSI